MKTRLLLILALVAAPLARAQFDFGKLTKGLDAMKSVGDDVNKVAKGTAKIGPEEERKIGDCVALEIISKYGGLVRDDEIMQRVNLMGRALGRYSSRPDLDWRFGVLESKSINAFSAPDGYVFITRGLYDMAESDDALAAILGHEISHITKRHALTLIERTESAAAVTSLAAEHSRNVQQAEAQLRQFDLGLEKIINTLFEKGFDPQTEYEADKEGRLLAVTSGYASGGLRAVLTDIEQHSSGNPDVFSTHPPFKERIKRLPE